MEKMYDIVQTSYKKRDEINESIISKNESLRDKQIQNFQQYLEQREESQNEESQHEESSSSSSTSRSCSEQTESQEDFRDEQRRSEQFQVLKELHQLGAVDLDIIKEKIDFSRISSRKQVPQIKPKIEHLDFLPPIKTIAQIKDFERRKKDCKISKRTQKIAKLFGKECSSPEHHKGSCSPELADMHRLSLQDILFKTASVKIDQEHKVICFKKQNQKQGRIILNEILLKQSYFQFRITQANCNNPKVCVGLCTDGFALEQDLSWQTNAWCINLSSGDIFGNKRWRQYYEMDEENVQPQYWNEMQEKQSINFKYNTVIGVYVDQKRGFINFFKDGEDLGQAFKIDKNQELHPFIQFNESCSLQIFQPEIFEETESSILQQSPSEIQKSPSDQSSSGSEQQQETKLLSEIDQQTFEFRLRMHEESQKLKYQEQILKDVRSTLRQKETEVLYQDVKPRKSVRFIEDYSGIILNSIQEPIDMNTLVHQEATEVKPFDDNISNSVRTIEARPSARVQSQPHFYTNLEPRRSENLPELEKIKVTGILKNSDFRLNESFTEPNEQECIIF